MVTSTSLFCQSDDLQCFTAVTVIPPAYHMCHICMHWPVLCSTLPHLHCINLQSININVPALTFLLKIMLCSLENALLSGAVEELISPSKHTGNPAGAVKAILQWRHTMHFPAHLGWLGSTNRIRSRLLEEKQPDLMKQMFSKGLCWHFWSVVDCSGLAKLLLLAERSRFITCWHFGVIKTNSAHIVFTDKWFKVTERRPLGPIALCGANWHRIQLRVCLDWWFSSLGLTLGSMTVTLKGVEILSLMYSWNTEETLMRPVDLFHVTSCNWQWSRTKAYVREGRSLVRQYWNLVTWLDVNHQIIERSAWLYTNNLPQQNRSHNE